MDSRLDVSPWVAAAPVAGPSYGMRGVVSVSDGRCGVAIAGAPVSARAARFAEARALGRALLSPTRHAFILSTLGSPEEQAARAFAAELLAPAVGIRAIVGEINERDESSLEAAADHFDVSPLVIQHQVDNQLA